MNKMIKYIGFVVLTMMISPLFGQQEPHFTQYFDNTLFVNPAYAGSRGMLNMTAIHREQWIGFDGGPRSTTFSMHSPLRYESIGVGLTAVNDQAGPIKQTMIYGDFSYTVRFKKQDRKLSFGIKGGVNMINVTTASLSTTESNDPKLMQNARNTMNPNFGLGIYYHTPKFFIGASSPKILENSYNDLGTTNLEKRHYYGIMGGVMKLSSTWKLRPTTQVKVTSGAPLSLDMSIAGIYRDKIWFGAMYRLDAAVGVFVQFQITDQFKLGIASDFGTQAIRNYNHGTFEAMLSYDFYFRKDGVRSPRYF